MKIKLAILEKDNSYLNRIVAVFSTKYADKFQIYSFKMTVLMTINDNLNLTKVTVYLDGKECQSWTGDSITKMISGGGNFSIDIPGDSMEAHSLRVVAVDAAGNEKTEEVNDFYVTTNLWVRYYNNKGVFYGSIAGTVALAGLLVFLVVWKRRKDEKKV